LERSVGLLSIYSTMIETLSELNALSHKKNSLALHVWEHYELFRQSLARTLQQRQELKQYQARHRLMFQIAKAQ